MLAMPFFCDSIYCISFVYIFFAVDLIIAAAEMNLISIENLKFLSSQNLISNNNLNFVAIFFFRREGRGVHVQNIAFVISSAIQICVFILSVYFKNIFN